MTAAYRSLIEDPAKKLRSKARNTVLVGIWMLVMAVFCLIASLVSPKQYDENAKYMVYENDRPTSVLSGREANERYGKPAVAFFLVFGGLGSVVTLAGIGHYRVLRRKYGNNA